MIQAELRAVTLPLVKLVRSDPKNPAYCLQEDRESSGHFIFFAIYADQADFEAHNAQPYVQAWFAKLPDLAIGGVKITKMKILGAPGSRRHLPAHLAEPERQQAPLDTITFKITRASRTVGPLFTSKDPNA